MSTLKSPLRYPGGKSRAIPKILEQLPESFLEFREPFVGGGSVFVAIRQKFPAVKVWINDLNFDLYCFWKIAQANTRELTDAITKIKNETKNGRVLFEEFRNSLNNNLSDFEEPCVFLY